MKEETGQQIKLKIKSGLLSAESYSELLLSCLRNEVVKYHHATSMTSQTEQVELAVFCQHVPGTILLHNQLSEQRKKERKKTCK